MLVFREGLVWRAPGTIAQDKDAMWLPTRRWVPAAPTRTPRGRGALPPPASEEGWPIAGFGFLPQAPPSAGTGHHTPVPRVVVPEVRGR